jgi:actin-binding protein anillin
MSVEVYGLKTFRTVNLPHNMKYHIKTPKTTPKAPATPKTKTLFHSTLTPSKKSTPGGASSSTSSSGSTSRLSNFSLVGALVLDLCNVRKGAWSLSLSSNSSSSAILSPHISMSVDCTTKCEFRQSGFLTLFKDVGGLGAWHRRWASLDNKYNLLFWRYPEDEGAGKVSLVEFRLPS